MTPHLWCSKHNRRGKKYPPSLSLVRWSPLPSPILSDAGSIGCLYCLEMVFWIKASLPSQRKIWTEYLEQEAFLCGVNSGHLQAYWVWWRNGVDVRVDGSTCSGAVPLLILIWQDTWLQSELSLDEISVRKSSANRKWSWSGSMSMTCIRRIILEAFATQCRLLCRLIRPCVCVCV